MVDRSRISWSGTPFALGSKYYFSLDDELVKFVLDMLQAGIDSQKVARDDITMDIAKGLKIVTENESRAELSDDGQAAQNTDSGPPDGEGV
jgi:hypothetical protein